MNILHLDSSILADASVSRQLSTEITAKLKASNPSAAVTYRDLAANPLPHLTMPEFGTEEAATTLADFKAADIVVVGAPMYNFGISSQLKAWIDRIAVAGQTFRYTEKGPEGLMGGKRVIIASSTGGFYGPGAAAAPMNHASVYLTQIFNFLGITDVEVITAEGLAMGPEQKEKSITGAQTAIGKIAA